MRSKSGLGPLSGHWTGRGLASQLRSEKNFEDYETQRVSEVSCLQIINCVNNRILCPFIMEKVATANPNRGVNV